MYLVKNVQKINYELILELWLAPNTVYTNKEKSDLHQKLCHPIRFKYSSKMDYEEEDKNGADPSYYHVILN